MGVYTSKYTGEQIDNLLEQVENGGGAGGSSKKVTLWEGEVTATNQNITLAQSLEDFDYLTLEVEYYMNNNRYRHLASTMLDTGEIKQTYGASENFIGSIYANVLSGTMSTLTQIQLSYIFNSATEMYVAGAAKHADILGWALKKVTGIKF